MAAEDTPEQVHGRACEAGAVGDERERLALRVQLWLTTVTVVANLVGAGVVVVLIAFVVPTPEDTELGPLTVVLIAGYIVGALLVGAVWGTRRLVPRLEWVVYGCRAGPAPSSGPRSARRSTSSSSRPCCGPGPGGVHHGHRPARRGADRARWRFTVAGGAVTTCATAYLLSRARPPTRRRAWPCPTTRRTVRSCPA